LVNTPEEEGAEKLNRLPKIVFTKTLKHSEWANTTLATGNLVYEITKLKKQDGNDIIVYGGADFVASLIQYKPIEEFHFLVNPTLLENGKTIFKNIIHSDLLLKKTIGFECRISVLNYEHKQN
jgi:dihydrofolate reductase